MREARFDGITKSFGQRLSRRGTVKGIGAVVTAAALAWPFSDHAAALPFCGNCPDICSNCIQHGVACQVCRHCAGGRCSSEDPEGHLEPHEPF